MIRGFTVEMWYFHECFPERGIFIGKQPFVCFDEFVRTPLNLSEPAFVKIHVHSKRSLGLVSKDSSFPRCHTVKWHNGIKSEVADIWWQILYTQWRWIFPCNLANSNYVIYLENDVLNESLKVAVYIKMNISIMLQKVQFLSNQYIFCIWNGVNWIFFSWFCVVLVHQFFH